MIIAHFLFRDRLYNMAELVQVLATELDPYFKDRMLKVALLKSKALHNPPPAPKHITKPMIHADDSGLFFVSSQNEVEAYMVDANVKVCSCPTGRTGSLCKHLLAVEYYFPKNSSITKIYYSYRSLQPSTYCCGQGEGDKSLVFWNKTRISEIQRNNSERSTVWVTSAG